MVAGQLLKKEHELGRLSMHVPISIDDDVEALVKNQATSTSPVYVAIRPEPYAEINECVPAVHRKISIDGGEEVIGWAIWKHQDFMMIEAEFHSVWRSPNNDLVDVTPKPRELDAGNILFLPDPNLKYEGIQINNVRLNISPNKNRLVDDLIATFDTHFRLQNEGDLAYQDAVPVREDILMRLANFQGMVTSMLRDGKTRNSVCYCTDGQEYKTKYKRCCGKGLDKYLDNLVHENMRRT